MPRRVVTLVALSGDWEAPRWELTVSLASIEQREALTASCMRVAYDL